MDQFVEWPDAEIENSVAARFEQMAAAYAGCLAVQGAHSSLTYAELNAHANHLARQIVARRGTLAEPVAVLMEQSPAQVMSLLAILKAGHFYTALESAMPDPPLREILVASEARLVLASPALADRARQLAPDAEVVVVELSDAAPAANNLALPISPGAYLNLSFTSGSTGRPKGVLQSQRNLLHSIWTTHSRHRTTPADRQALLHSVSFGASIANLWGSLLTGGSLHLYDIRQRGLGDLPGWLVNQGITIYHSVPTLFRRMLRAASAEAQFTAMRLVKLGGETVNRRDVEMFDAHFPPTCILRHTFGSTEALGATAFLYQRGQPFEGNLVPIGRPHPKIEVWLQAEDGQRAAPGEPGELVVRSRYLSPGYWRQPDATAERFRPDPEGGDRRLMLTGDLARWLPDGNLTLLGRRDSLVKVRGLQVDLNAVEAALLQLPEVREAVAVAQPNAHGDARLVAYYVPESPTSPDQLRGRLGASVAASLVPDVFVAMDALPVLAFGKVDRRRLPPVPELSTPAGGEAGSETRARLSALWAQVLQRPAVAPDDNFFDLGGDSLAAGDLGVLVERAFGVRLEMRDLFDAPRLSQLAHLIESRAPGAAPSGAAAPARPATDLDVALRRLGAT